MNHNTSNTKPLVGDDIFSTNDDFEIHQYDSQTHPSTLGLGEKGLVKLSNNLYKY